MHIVHVTEVTGGGVIVWLREVCPVLRRRGWKVTLVCAAGPAQAEIEATDWPDGVEIVPVSISRKLSPVALWESIAELREVLNTRNPDIVHLHSSMAGGIGRIAARLSGNIPRTVYSPHGLAFLRRDVAWPIRGGFWLAEWLGARFGGTAVACSRGEQNAMASLVRKANLHVIENGVNVDAITCRARLDAGTPLVGSNGRLVAQKAPGAFADLATRLGGEDARFAWIGGGGETETNRLREAGIEVAGWMSREAAIERMCELDLYVSTARWEGMPLSLIEAQLAGIPAVVTDVVGNRDVVVHGKTGFVAKNPDELADYTRRLIRDRALRVELGQIARETAVRRFDVERMADEFERLYRRVVAV